MAHNSRLPMLEEVMNGSPFEIVDSPWGHIERWRASTLSTGTMGALTQVYDVVRNDAANLAARADEDTARTALIQHLCEKIAEFEQRFEALEARVNEAEEQRRADQEREAEFNEEPLELPPDIAAHQEPTPPTKIGDGAHDTHAPSGELHSIAAKGEPSETTANDEEELPEPPLETETDAKGVPLSYGNVPTSYVHGEDQVEFAIPEPGMTSDVRRKPRGGVVAQPISVSLNRQ